MITRPCVVCGKDIGCYKSTYNKKKYCSIECRESETHTTANCLDCGKEYKVAQSRYYSKHHRYKHCSSKCYENAKSKEEKIRFYKNLEMCTHCGVYFSSKRNGVSGKYFCSQRCSKEYQVGANSPFYKTGKSLHSSGYITVRTGIKRYELEHRIIMENHIGRKLLINEVVHHIDGNRKNNDINNLQLMDKREHDGLHTRERHERNRTKNASSNL